MNPVNFPDYQSKSVAEFMTKAKQRTPIFPEIPPIEVRRLRAKLILEETIETINALGFMVGVERDSSGVTTGFALVECGTPDLVGICDGCADLKVVVVGTELACGINGKPVFEEVMESNMTKFDGGGLDANGKVIKGPNYRPPNIERVLREQGWKQ